jgi:hypothetical protein
MKIYFYCYDYAIDRDTGEVDAEMVHVTEINPMDLEGAVLLTPTGVEVEFEVPSPDFVARRTVDMLHRKSAKVKKEATEKLERINDRLSAFMALTHQQEEI